MLSVLTIAVRVFQLLFAIILLGLSVTLVRQQVYGSAPATSTYSSFAGGFGMVVAAVGIAGLFVEAIPAGVPMALDAVLGVFVLAAGIAWAVGLEGVSCTDTATLANCNALYANALVNEGCVSVPVSVPGADGGGAETAALCGIIPVGGEIDVKNVCSALAANCQKAQTAEVFSLLLLALAIGLLALGFVLRRKGGVGRPSYAV